MNAPAANLDGILAAIAQGVEQVEVELRDLVHSPVRTVAEVGEHTLNAGGKRLRPAFVTLAARATGHSFDPQRAIRIGACLELVHMATLIHDDVIDNAATRRGRATAAAIYGNTASILSGDVMLAKAMVVLADDGDIDVIRAVSRAVVEMAEGEAREVETRGRFDLSEEDHLEILGMKTAAFVECCCRVGGMLAGASKEVQQSLATYGRHVGLAFQIADDLLDFRGDQAVTGKPLATDFREGCATLPLIRLRPLLDANEETHLREKFGNGVTDSEIHDLVRLMDERGATREAEAAAKGQIDLATRALSALPASENRDLLVTIAEFVLSRRA